jgi:voltage-gated potassium channel
MPHVSRVERWERTSEVPLLLLAAAFLVAYAWPILDPRLDPDLETVCEVASWTVWAAFAVDLVIRLSLAEDRRHYAWRHWYDVALIVLPVLRPLRLLRLLAFARILNRSAVGGLAGRVSVYVAGTAVLAVALGALAVLEAERGAEGGNITSAGDALWWAATTVTTVGYGDRYPVTTTGRLVAVALMLVGIAVVSSLTAVIASWLVENVGQDSREGR